MRLIGFNYTKDKIYTEIFFKESERHSFEFTKFYSNELQQERYFVHISLNDIDYLLNFTVNEQEKEYFISNYYYFLIGDDKLFHINNTIEFIRFKINNEEN